MKKLIFGLFILFLLFGCQQQYGHSNPHLSLLNQTSKEKKQQDYSLGYRLADKQKERETRLELSKIEAKTKIEIEKIRTENQLKIAQVQANTTKDVAHTNYKTKVETSKIDALTKKEDTIVTIYITIAISITIIFGMILLYLNNKKERELKNKLLQDQLRHEEMLREKERQEQRLLKLIELAGDKKLSPKMEEAIILSLGVSNDVIEAQIEHKESEDDKSNEKDLEIDTKSDDVEISQEEDEQKTNKEEKQ
jgi:hypothetical protein